MINKRWVVRQLMFNFPVRCAISVLVLVLGMFNPTFYIIGGFLGLFYALPSFILMCCLIIAIEGLNDQERAGIKALLAIIAAVAFPLFFIMRGFALL